MRHEEYMLHALNTYSENTENGTTDLQKTDSKLPQEASERKAIPIYTGFVKYFPLAIAEVAKISLKGGIQHGQTAQTLHWDRSKSGDELDAMMRHVIDEDWAQVAWRAMANLQKQMENKDD